MGKLIQFPRTPLKSVHLELVDHMVDEILEEVTDYFEERGLDLELLKDFDLHLYNAVFEGVPKDITQTEFDQLKEMMRGRWMKILNIGF